MVSFNARRVLEMLFFLRHVSLSVSSVGTVNDITLIPTIAIQYNLDTKSIEIISFCSNPPCLSLSLKKKDSEITAPATFSGIIKPECLPSQSHKDVKDVPRSGSHSASVLSPQSPKIVEDVAAPVIPFASIHSYLKKYFEAGEQYMIKEMNSNAEDEKAFSMTIPMKGEDLSKCTTNNHMQRIIESFIRKSKELVELMRPRPMYAFRVSNRVAGIVLYVAMGATDEEGTEDAKIVDKANKVQQINEAIRHTFDSSYTKSSTPALHTSLGSLVGAAALFRFRIGQTRKRKVRRSRRRKKRDDGNREELGETQHPIVVFVLIAMGIFWVVVFAGICYIERNRRPVDLGDLTPQIADPVPEAHWTSGELEMGVVVPTSELPTETHRGDIEMGRREAVVVEDASATPTLTSEQVPTAAQLQPTTTSAHPVTVLRPTSTHDRGKT